MLEALAAKEWRELHRPNDVVRRLSRSLLRQLVAETDAIFDIDRMTVLRQPIDQGTRQVRVVQKRSPFGEITIGSYQRRLLLMPLVQTAERITR